MKALRTLLVVLSIVCASWSTTALAQATYTAPDWNEEKVEGRLLSLVHTKGEGRLEAWSTRLPDTGLVAFREKLSAKLKASGFQGGDGNEALIKGYPAVERVFTKSLAGQEYTMRILEVHIRGVLWHFSCYYRDSEELSGKETTEHLHAMAAALLDN